MRSLLGIIAISLFASVLCIGCQESKDNAKEELAQSMYQKSVVALKEGASKIRTAKDSTSVDSIFDSCQERLEKICFSYPADTDLALNEGQNDTLAMLTERLAKARHERLYHFAHPEPEVSDSTCISQESQSKAS